MINKFKIKVEEISESLYCFNFKDQYQMTSTLMRVQEFYENAKIRNQFLSVEQVMDSLYSQDSGKEFTYFYEVEGCNMSGDKILEFFKNVDGFPSTFLKNVDGFPLVHQYMDKEIHFWETIKENIDITKDFYLIATYGKNDADAFNHEIAHGLYYLNKNYKRDMNKLIKDYKHKDKAYKALRDIQYATSVLKDELQAYFATSTKKYLVNHLKMDKEVYIPKEFRQVYIKYCKEI